MSNDRDLLHENEVLKNALAKMNREYEFLERMNRQLKLEYEKIKLKYELLESEHKALKEWARETISTMNRIGRTMNDVKLDCDDIISQSTMKTSAIVEMIKSRKYSKIQLVKEYRGIFGVGLKEAKDSIEDLEKRIYKGEF